LGTRIRNFTFKSCIDFIHTGASALGECNLIKIMADKKLTGLTTELEEVPHDDDIIHVVDTSDTTDDATGTSKKWKIITWLKTLFALDADVIKKDGSVDYTGNQSMGTNKLTSLADGVDSGDAVNKGQLDDKQDILTEGEFVDGDKTKLDGIEDGAEVNDVAGEINSADAKTTPHNDDVVGLVDSEASNVLKKLSWTNIKATLKTYFDTLYQTVLTFGIADNNAVEIDDADAADNDYAKFTANGLEGRSYAEVKQDLDLEVGTDVAAVDQTMHIGTTEVAINRASAALTLAGITLTTPNIGTPSAGTLTNCTGLPLTGLVDDTSTALGVGSIELGHASDTTLARSAAGKMTVEGKEVSVFDTTSEASSATPTPTGGSKENEYYLTALAADATFAAPSGTPANGNTLVIRIKDNGTARDLDWNAIYEGTMEDLPTTTTISKTMYLGFIYDSAKTKWSLLSLLEEE
jgi:hypothetical protein